VDCHTPLRIIIIKKIIMDVRKGGSWASAPAIRFLEKIRIENRKYAEYKIIIVKSGVVYVSV
jgi:hypothetical protein